MNPLLTTVATQVAGEFGSRLSSILGSTRGRPEDARARAISMYVYMMAHPGDARPCYTEIGRQFGRDRTTVRHALSRVVQWRKSEKGFDSRLSAVQMAVEASTGSR